MPYPPRNPHPPLAGETTTLLTSAAGRHGAQLQLLSARDDIARAATILAAADRTRYLAPRLHKDMIAELRWPEDPDPDSGIDVRSLELDSGQLAMLDILRRPDVMAHLAEWNAGSALGDGTRDRVLASSALAVITVPGDRLSDYARGGAAAELVWIIAQHNGLSVQPISPVFLYARTRSELDELSPTFADEFAELQRDFHTLAGVPNDQSTVLLLRFTIGPPPSVHSRRSPQRVQIS